MFGGLLRSREEQKRRRVVMELVTKIVHERAARWLTERVASKVASQEDFIQSFERQERMSLAQTLDRDLPRCNFNVVEADGRAIAATDRMEKVARCRKALAANSVGWTKPLVLMANQGLFGVFLEALHDQFPPHDEFGPVPTPGSQRGPRFEVDLERGKLLASAAVDVRLLGSDKGVFVATFVCDFVVDATRRAVVVRCRRTDDFLSATSAQPQKKSSVEELVEDVAGKVSPSANDDDHFFFRQHHEAATSSDSSSSRHEEDSSRDEDTTARSRRPPPSVPPTFQHHSQKVKPRHACSCF